MASPPFIPIYTVRRTAFPFLTGQAMRLLFFLLPSFSSLTMTPPFHVHPLTCVCVCVCVLGQLLVIVKMVNNLFSFFFHAQFPAYKNVLCIEDGHGQLIAAPLPPTISNFPIEKNGGYAYPFGISFSLNHSERELHLITRRGARHKMTSRPEPLTFLESFQFQIMCVCVCMCFLSPRRPYFYFTPATI